MKVINDHLFLKIIQTFHNSNTLFGMKLMIESNGLLSGINKDNKLLHSLLGTLIDKIDFYYINTTREYFVKHMLSLSVSTITNIHWRYT